LASELSRASGSSCHGLAASATCASNSLRNPSLPRRHPIYRVKVVAHEAPGMHLPVRFRASLPQGLDEQLPVIVPGENIIAPSPRFIRW
jgi:hypothetical protein